MPKVLIIGACGQIGSELTFKLKDVYGYDNVIASDIAYNNLDVVNSGIFEIVDAQDYSSVRSCVDKHKIDTIYLMAAMLSATGEKHPKRAWDLNMSSLFHVLNLAKDGFIKHVFWPSSIAVFGPTTPKQNTPQHTIMEPTTVYGITKQVGERWCEYYHDKYGVDVRSIRYPGLISWKTLPGGGTTDYAVEIYHEAIKHKSYECFLSENTELPMMYMDDAINATVNIMKAPSDAIKIRSSYNLAAMSFTPAALSEAIKVHIPEFEITYRPDYRQGIADSWPKSINDSEARQDWNWQHDYDIEKMTAEMISKLQQN
ncbi:NAD-dependent epimerase/dehydratase family protein [Psychroserpens sp.]|uniref:NAD-dependent epimerase/dehydratase family protein n=1 Tax=Psychroserpens sp. TaxID=2020870 RepID=UPI001B085D38|nr:NAD-dependent epimerase/dehydratase family protein [Psychroserpens sp.]MBO6605500.1 NAD-dependent epimerase/dehydratase family protein [Psychroserpens sp.]MBO6630659.1 NAD-dependent epimerase/dehydratase family protein [Psychroserpens sp.]MBO6653691.1 NAD-dependent epimerase/dehydratase family protein [Psychroserpens sp.]MBO6682012.1 NAD-dependent epimerase/dehydratase family protein [Psychroserpens sp.]MBO6748874.1 NAD-dependent epimerase/dehydratase family protein [Psychroserpens sp.]